MAIYLGQNLHSIAHLIYIGSTDEGHRHLAHTLEFALGVEASQLPAIGISLGQDIHGGQMLAVQHDESGTGTQHGQSATDGLSHLFPHAQIVHDARHGGTLAAGDDECLLGLMPVGQVAYEECLHSHTLQHLSVFLECPLQGHYSNPHFPRSAMSSSISCSLMPTIASPRSSLSSASILGLL